MKQLVAIAISLLLIVARTIAVQVPVSSGVPLAKPACCGEDCHCCVSQSGAPVVPPVEPIVAGAAQYHFILPPAAVVSFTLAAPADVLSSGPTAVSCAAALPLFRRICALLI